MNSPIPIPDVQNSADTRQIAINKVGIKSIRHPIKVQDKSAGIQHTIAVFNMYVGLPDRFIDHGEQGQLLAELGLDKDGIVRAVRNRTTTQ